VSNIHRNTHTEQAVADVPITCEIARAGVPGARVSTDPSCGFHPQGLRDFQCWLNFHEWRLDVPQHIQPGLVDGLVKPGAMSAVATLSSSAPEDSPRHKRHRWKRSTSEPKGSHGEVDSPGRLWLKDGMPPADQAMRLLTLVL
jgi:hypothetical protein